MWCANIFDSCKCHLSGLVSTTRALAGHLRGLTVKLLLRLHTEMRSPVLRARRGQPRWMDTWVDLLQRELARTDSYSSSSSFKCLLLTASGSSLASKQAFDPFHSCLTLASLNLQIRSRWPLESSSCSKFPPTRAALLSLSWLWACPRSSTEVRGQLGYHHQRLLHPA